MLQPSNTPPDGDFVRYVDRLTAAQAAARQAPPRAGAPFPPAAAPGLMPPRGGSRTAPIAWMRHLKWAAGLWVATKILDPFVPGAGFLFLPLLAAYAAWAFHTARPGPDGAFFSQLGALARRAAEEARKIPSIPPKNKP